MNKALEGEKPQKFQFNAPEPQPPFELKQPQLSASQQSDGILLKWGEQETASNSRYGVQRKGKTSR